MRSIFSEHQLLRCQIIEQCLMLDADVLKGVGGKPHADKGGLSDVLYRALPILDFANIADTDIADIFWANMSTDIADTDTFLSKYFVKVSSHVMFCSFVC